MLTLALETSTRNASVALLRERDSLGCVDLPPEQRTTEAILPSCQDLLEQTGHSLDQIELIGVSIGPGSFTGLRIGVTVAKTLAYALRVPTRAVASLRAAAFQATASRPESAERIIAVADAQRGQLYVQAFDAREFDTGATQTPTGVNQSTTADRPTGAVFRQPSSEDVEILDTEQLLETLGPNSFVTGEGLKRHQERFRQQAPQTPLADSKLWRLSAVSIGQLAAADYAAGQVDDFWTLKPRYVRASAAEEKLTP